MKRLRTNLIAGLVLAAVLAGCQNNPIANILPGNDPLVVNAERAAKASLDTFDAVTTFDYQNHDFMVQNIPQVHEGVQTLRKDFPPLYTAFRTATKQYKASRTAENANQVSVMLKQVQQKGSQAQDLLSQAVVTKEKLTKPQGQPSPGSRALE